MGKSQFDPAKAVAAVGYLVSATHETLYPLMKMMYLADKLHLERYGRFIAGDSYAAMRKGPVPSATYDLMKCARGECVDVEGGELAKRAFEYRDDHEVRNRVEPDLSELSPSDVDCLNEVIRLHEKFGKWAIRDMSHDEAWKKSRSWIRFGSSTSMPIETIAESLTDGSEVLEHLRDSHPGSA